MQEFNQCPIPNCQLPNVAEDIVELKDGIKELNKKQEQIIELMVSFKILEDKIKSLEKEKDNIFSRLTTIEQSMITKRDLIGLGTLMTIIFSFITFILRVVEK